MNNTEDLTSANGKMRILKLIRQLDWSRENHQAFVLQALTNLEIAARARTNEELKFGELSRYAAAEFNNTRTLESFSALLQVYKKIHDETVKNQPSTASVMNVLYTQPENKVLTNEDAQPELDGYFDIDEDDYNPVASAFNDHLDMLDEINELTKIEANINLDWSEAPVATVTPVSPASQAREFWKHVDLDDFILDKKPQSKLTGALVKPDFDFDLVKLPRQPKSFLNITPRAALIAGVAIAALAVVAISVLTPFVVPTLVALIGGTALIHSMVIAGGVGLGLGSATALTTKIYNNLKQLFKSKPVVTVKQQKTKVVNETVISNTVPPQSDNIHEDLVIEKIASPKIPVVAKVSQSSQTLFHKNKSGHRVEPQQLLVPQRGRAR